MNAVSLLRREFKAAHDLLEATAHDVAPEQAQWLPPGIANPIGATYAHIVLSEDFTLSGLLRGMAPLGLSTWAGKTGTSELPPSTPFVWAEWGRKVQVDLPALRKYARAVYASTDEYLATLTDADLDRIIDLTALGAGQMTLADFLGGVMLGNVIDHCGEIAALKGLLGVKGSPV